MTVHVIDDAGKPVAGASVAIKMTRHAFAFGCVYNPSRIVGPKAADPVNQRYRDTFSSTSTSG
jgi:hypothetical protein